MSSAVLERPVPVLDAPPVPAPPVPVAQPRLSELMRKGARCHRQGPGYVYNPKTHATCAIGAAIVGLRGAHYLEDTYVAGWRYFARLLQEHTGVLLDQPVALPTGGRFSSLFAKAETGEIRCTLESAIIHLNDTQCWSREKIADWLASLGY